MLGPPTNDGSISMVVIVLSRLTFAPYEYVELCLAFSYCSEISGKAIDGTDLTPNKRGDTRCASKDVN